MSSKNKIATLAILLAFSALAFSDEAKTDQDIKKIVIGSANYAYYTGNTVNTVYFNKEPIGTYNKINYFSFMITDKDNLFFVCNMEDGQYLIYKDRKYGPYENAVAGRNYFLDLGDEIVYLAKKTNEHWKIFKNGTEIGMANATMNAYSRIAADKTGENIAYPYSDANNKWFIKLNDKVLGGPFDSLAFISMLDNGSVIYTYEKDKKQHFVGANGDVGQFDSILNPAASQDGKHYAFVGQSGRLQALYYDGKIDKSINLDAGCSFGPNMFLTTPEGTALAHFLGINDKRYLFIGNAVTEGVPRTFAWPNKVMYNEKSEMFYFVNYGNNNGNLASSSVYRTYLSAQDKYKIFMLPGDASKKAYPILPTVKICELPENYAGFALCHRSDSYALALREGESKMRIKYGPGEVVLDRDPKKDVNDVSLQISPNDEWLSFLYKGVTRVMKGSDVYMGAFNEEKVVYFKDGAIIEERITK